MASAAAIRADQGLHFFLFAEDVLTLMNEFLKSIEKVKPKPNQN